MTRATLAPALLVAVVGTAIASLVVLGVGIGSIAARQEHFSIGITIMLVGYGLLVGVSAYLGWRRLYLARGMMVTFGLLHLAVAINLVTHGDVPQKIGAAVMGVLALVTVVAAVSPSTRRALTRSDQPQPREAP